MGLISKLLSFVRTMEGDAHVSDVKVDPGGGANVTAHHFGPSGDDSHPLRDDYVASVEAPGAGNQMAVGYLDPTNEPKAAAGEKRIYSRDGDGQVVAVVWLKNDGSIVVESPSDTTVLKVETDGTVRLGSGTANKGVARNGDQVKVTIPASTFIVSVAGGSGGPATGTLNPDAVEVTGTITSASSSVMAKD